MDYLIARILYTAGAIVFYIAMFIAMAVAAILMGISIAIDNASKKHKDDK